MTQNIQRSYVLAWEALARWDLKSARAASFRIAHPSFVPLGEFLADASEAIQPSLEPSKSWPVYGVNNADGVMFSHWQMGESFKSSYKRIRKDWFFHNPTRANVGSLGRVPEVPEDAITSPEYQIWKIRRCLLPEFLEILIKTPLFLELVDCHRVGAVKERLFTENLFEIPIPVLNRSQQLKVVSGWQSAKDAIQAGTELVERLKQSIDQFFFNALGLKSPEELQLPKQLNVEWADLARWGVRHNQLKHSGADIADGIYPAVELNEVLEVVQYGTSEKANEEGRGVPVIRILNIKDRRLDLSDLKHVKLAPKTVQSLRLIAGDVLIIRTSGSRDLVGTSAVFSGDDDFVFASYLIRLRFDNSKVLPEFASWFLNSSLGRQQIDAVSREIMMNNINSTEIRGLMIPMPPISIQHQIMNQIAARRSDIDCERARIDLLAANAMLEAERLIFSDAA